MVGALPRGSVKASASRALKSPWMRKKGSKRITVGLKLW